MNQNHHDAAAVSRAQSLFTNPWAQAGLSAVLTLIPARSYPGWLRRGLIWAPAVGLGVGSAYLVAHPAAGPGTAEERRRRPMLGAVPGTAAGLLMSGITAGAFWADEKIERSLRRMCIPFPRAAMGTAAGAAAWWSVTKDNERRQAERSTQR